MATTKTARKPQAAKLQDAVAEKLPADLAGRLPEILSAGEEKNVPVFGQDLKATLSGEEPTAQDYLKSFRAISGLKGSRDSHFEEWGVNAGDARKVLCALDQCHLERALQAAVTLEFATLPPYLCAIWSIKDDLDPVAKSIREIVQEEMLHMALVCNMLSAIGGMPKINSAVPTYPGSLPMDVHPELTVSLSGLTDDALDVFMEIERPEDPEEHLELKGTVLAEQAARHDDKTIGEFYDEILEAFRRVDPTFSTARQITGPLSWMVVENLEDVARAIHIIKRQGEGADSPVDSSFQDLAHYYRFAEIRVGKELDYNPESGLWKFWDDRPVKRPEVWPMAVVPAGGYRREDVSDEVWRLLQGFDRTYSRVLDLLQSVWEADGGQAAFWHAIDNMFELQKTAIALMEKALPGGQGTYGPCFRYVPEDDR